MTHATRAVFITLESDYPGGLKYPKTHIKTHCGLIVSNASEICNHNPSCDECATSVTWEEYDNAAFEAENKE